MNIRFNGGKMFVEHPSGHINSYTKEQVIGFKDRVTARIAELELEATNLDRTILAITASED